VRLEDFPFRALQHHRQNCEHTGKPITFIPSQRTRKRKMFPRTVVCESNRVME